MSDYTAVDQASMQEGINDLSTAYRAITSHLEQLEGELNSSLAKWDGAAQAAYREAQVKWNAAANHMGQVVNKMSTVLTQISQNYDSNERRIQGSWS